MSVLSKLTSAVFSQPVKRTSVGLGGLAIIIGGLHWLDQHDIDGSNFSVDYVISEALNDLDSFEESTPVPTITPS